MYKTSSGKPIDFSKSKEIASGGEGRIVEHPSDRRKVLKIYHKPRANSFSDHLGVLGSLSNLFIKPEEVIYSGGKNPQVVGFIMDYVNFNDYWLFNNLFNKGFCNSNGIDRNFKITVLEKMKLAIEEVHSKGLVVGDLNQYNIFVSKKGDILFADVDSYASKLQPHSGVLIDDIRDWTTLNIDNQTDAWAYDILAFWSICFMHPFKYISKSNTGTLEQRVKKGQSVLTRIPDIKLPALYEPPTGETLRQFNEIFSGRRYLISLSGTAPAIVSNVIKQSLQSQQLKIQEIGVNITHVNAANNYIAVRHINGTWSKIETTINGVVRYTAIFSCDELYPTDNNSLYAMKMGKTLVSGNMKDTTPFSDPQFYYNNGSLSVLDYTWDLQTNFNLNNQLAGIERSQTPVFAKSVLYRDAPIQNFGAKKFLNIPIRNTYTLIPIDIGTINAYYCKGVIGLEYKKSNKAIKFSISDGKLEAQLDYFPYFTVKDKTVFIPEEGYIEVYKDFIPIAKLEAPCTRSSKLYSTTSGLILLENNTLYLLNTK